MISRFLISFIALAAFIPLSSTISCFAISDLMGINELIHDKKACTAVFQTDGSVAFNGLSNYKERFPEEQDCQFQTLASLDGEGTVDIWFCQCYTDFCNKPFTFEAFTRRNYTLTD